MAVYRRLIPSTDPRFGRHVEHDDRSLAYAAPVLPRGALQAQQWSRRCPVLDQGQIGSCCGEAAAGWVGTDNAARPGQPGIDQTTALDLYHLATTLDEFDGVWEPDDTGSSGLGAAKALQAAGYCGTYTHAFTLRALATALQSGPALIGVSWYQSSFDPHTDGRVPVNTGSGLAGGHELCVDGYAPMADPASDRYWITNSWGTSWGVEGRAYFAGADLALLLSDDGDVTIPAAAVTPDPSPIPAAADVAFAAVLYPWVVERHAGGNAVTAKAGKAWLAAKGL